MRQAPNRITLSETKLVHSTISPYVFDVDFKECTSKTFDPITKMQGVVVHKSLDHSLAASAVIFTSKICTNYS